MARPRAIAVDLGGTNLRVGVVAADGEVLFHIAEPTRDADGPAAVLGRIAAMVAVARGHGGDAGPVVGIAAPGPLDTGTGVMLSVQSLPGFENLALRDELQRLLDAPVVVENDGIAGAIGEWRLGAGRGLSDMLYVTLSTGIGGGIIAGGHPLRGRRGLAGHIGHTFFDAAWDRQPGATMPCFEDFASGSALAHRARTETGFTGDAAVLATAAVAGDPVAGRLMEDEARAMGIGLASLAHVLSPQAIVLGGGLGLGAGGLPDAIGLHMERHLKAGFTGTPILPAHLGNHASLVGAAILAMEPELAAR